MLKNYNAGIFNLTFFIIFFDVFKIKFVIIFIYLECYLVLQAYILINCNTGSENNLISEFNELPEITEINGVWGKHDIILKIETYETQRVDEIVKRLRNHPNINDTYTMHVLYGQGGSIDQTTDR